MCGEKTKRAVGIYSGPVDTSPDIHRSWGPIYSVSRFVMTPHTTLTSSLTPSGCRTETGADVQFPSLRPHVFHTTQAQSLIGVRVSCRRIVGSSVSPLKWRPYGDIEMCINYYNYLRHGSYAILVLSFCLFVCLSVSNFTKKLVIGSLWKFYQRCKLILNKKDWLNFRSYSPLHPDKFLKDYSTLRNRAFFHSLADMSR